uniref:PhoLip_ATPase_C domain-containing protein n=1 Tax=Gongylonema pulchrum TaxID=637853 RepID=A0A183E9V6_9BILA
LAILHSLLLFFLSFAYLYNPVAWPNGRVGGWLMLGNSCYSFVVATVCLKALLECDSWTVVIVLSCIGSILLWFIFVAVYSVIWPILPLGEHMSGMAYIMFTSPSFWFAFLLIPIITLFTDFTIKAIRVNFAPTPRELACLHERSKEKLSGKNVELAGLRHEQPPPPQQFESGTTAMRKSLDGLAVAKSVDETASKEVQEDRTQDSSAEQSSGQSYTGELSGQSFTGSVPSAGDCTF